MAVLELTGMIVPEISVKNDLKDDAKIELETNISAKNAEYNATKNLFKITCYVTISSKEKDLFINIGLRGSFIIKYEKNEKPCINLDQWGKKSFEMLYPYLCSTLSSVMSNAMITPIYLPPLQS